MAYESEIKHRLGDYNDFPPEWTEISPVEYGKRLSDNAILTTQSRFMLDPDRKGITGTLLIFRDFTGVASTCEYVYVGPKFTDYEYQVKFWSFGCSHRFKEIPWNRQKHGVQFNYQHAWKCEICGEEQIVDSSD